MMRRNLLTTALCGAVTSWALAGMLVWAGPVAANTAGQTAAPQATAPKKTLRYAFPIAETGFDPAQISDAYSRIIAANMFEAPLTYDPLARPVKVVPQTAQALPEISDNYTRFVFRLRPGILFADDPAFKGSKRLNAQGKRELTAEDYVYTLKRHYDPKTKSPSLFQLENARILGLSELRKKTIANKIAFDYDAEVEGVRALDRYTFEVRLASPAPRFYYTFTDGGVMGAVAREVVEAYGDKIMALERNPNYREQYYDAQPAPDDAEAQAVLAKLKGKRIPMVDRVEVSIVEETQPRWLAFLNGEHDMIDRLPNEFATTAIPNNKLAPNLRKKGIQMQRVPAVDATLSYFGMENPVVGGYEPHKVALRRAISLAYDVEQEINQVRKGQAVPAQAIIPPMLTGFDPKMKTEMSDHDLARARALLDLYGYVDKDGDGWRDLPDGKPLLLEYSSQPDQASRQLQELWRKAMKAINVRIEFKIAKWPEQLKASRAGKLMMWGVAWTATNPDGSYFLDLLYGPNKGQANHSRFDLPAFNELYKRQFVMPDSNEREALMNEAKLLAVAYMPYKVTGHRILTDLTHPHVVGYRRHPFMRDFWRYVDVDHAGAAQVVAEAK